MSRKRLTERDAYWFGEEFWASAREPDEEEIDNIYMKLKDYEDAEEQGLLVRLPVPIGGSVYILDYTFECKLDYKCDDPYKFKCNDDVLCEHEYKKYRIREAKFKYEMLEYIGKTAFLTREEAEAALAEMEG